jgi:hypothetical protein
VQCAVGGAQAKIKKVTTFFQGLIDGRPEKGVLGKEVGVFLPEI